MDFKSFFFGPYPFNFELFDDIAFYDSGLSLVLGIALALLVAFKKQNPITKRLVKRFSNLFIAYGILGLLWVFFRYENALYLSWRLWMVIIGLVSLFFLVKLVVYALTKYRQEMADAHRNELKKKYL